MSTALGQDLQQAPSRIVTLVIRHQSLAGQPAAYQHWLQRAVTAARAACGHLGMDAIPPAEAGTAFTTLVRFADVERLQAWLASPERQALIAEVAPLLREADAPAVHADAEFWFNPPHPGVPPPPAWKQAVLTYLVIAPRTRLIPPLWQPLFARYPLLAGPVPNNLLITLCLVPLLVFLIMPRVSRLCAPWLNARSGVFSTPPPLEANNHEHLHHPRRRRDLFQGLGQEFFCDESWREHLRHHHRVTQGEQRLEAAARQYQTPGVPIAIRHLLGGAWRAPIQSHNPPPPRTPP